MTVQSGLSAVCDCCISSSYSFTIFKDLMRGLRSDIVSEVRPTGILQLGLLLLYKYCMYC